MWCLLLNKVLDKENLKLCNDTLCALDITCVLCRENIVSINHLFAKCPVSKSIWENLHPSIPRPHHSRSLCEWFRWKANNQNKKFASFFTWYTWKMRNLYIFSYNPIHLQATANKFVIKMWKSHSLWLMLSNNQCLLQVLQLRLSSPSIGLYEAKFWWGLKWEYSVCKSGRYN